jgi:hypothetical protein
LICSATVAMSVMSWMTEAWTWNGVRRPMTCRARTIRAGPDVKAEARNRGPSTAVCQYGRATFDEKRNAVTVWIEMAQAMEIRMAGKYTSWRGSRPR